MAVHKSPLVRSAFCPKKVDLTSGLTLHPGYNSVYRVTSLVANLGWVDLDLGCSTTLLGQ